MKHEAGEYLLHLFVCTNEKKKGGCANEGGDEVRKELKDWAKKHPEWKGRIRVNASGCMDRCKEAVVVAAYPQNEWFLKVRPKNVDELIEVLEKMMAESQKSSEEKSSSDSEKKKK